MKPLESTIVHKGTVVGESSVRMSFDEESSIHLMSILTDMYANKPLALVREYSTNALDSHKEAGIDEPISVTTPSSLNHNLVIKDYGGGMTSDEILEMYGQYGFSTKRDSNEFNGMLGIGCKSALSYTSQFTVHSVKSGVKTIAIISRDASGAGAVTIILSEETDEESGTEVTIPVDPLDAKYFREVAEEFFLYWGKGSVLLNGAEPYHFSDDPDSIKINDSTWIEPGSILPKGRRSLERPYEGAIRVVMGNVTYRVERHNLGLGPGSMRWTKGQSLVIFLDTGSINFAPSREEIVYDSISSDIIREKITEARESFTKILQNKLDSIDSHKDALKFYRKWMNSFSEDNTFIYRGVEYSDHSRDYFMWRRYSNHGENKAYRNNSKPSVALDSVQKDSIVIYNFKMKNVPNKLKEFLHSKYNRNNMYYFFFNEFEIKDIVDWVTVVDFDDIKEDYRKHRGAQRAAGALNRARAGVWSGYRLKDDGESVSYVQVNDIREPFEEGTPFILPGNSRSTLVPKLDPTGLMSLENPPRLILAPSGSRYETFISKSTDTKLIPLHDLFKIEAQSSVAKFEPLDLAVVVDTNVSVLTWIFNTTRLKDDINSDSVNEDFKFLIEQKADLGRVLSEGRVPDGSSSHILKEIVGYDSVIRAYYGRPGLTSTAAIRLGEEAANRIYSIEDQCRSIVETVGSKMPLLRLFHRNFASVLSDHSGGSEIKQDLMEYVERKLTE